MTDRVCVGAIAGAFGVRGEAKIKSFTDDPAAIATYGPLETEDATRRFDVKVTRTVKGGFAARLSGVSTREEAEVLKGTRLYVDRAVLPPPDEDEFYYADLLGLRVEDESGTVLGKVKAVQEFGAGDMIEYLPAEGGESVLLLFTREIVPTVDVAGGRIIVIPPAETSERSPD
jgi:16S rRNA processing protein RimM